LFTEKSEITDNDLVEM